MSARADVLMFGGLKEEGRRDGDKPAANRQALGADRSLTRAFARAARAPVSVPPDLCASLQAALIRRIGDFLGLARRAGQATAGFEKAREVLRTGHARLVLQASDGSEAERLRFLSGIGPDVVVIDPLPREALGRIFGRDYVVHVAVAPGKLAESLLHEAGRLAGLTNRSERITGSARAVGREIASVNDVVGTDG